MPAGNLLDKPAGLTFAEAACLPTAWLTAYRALFTAGALRPGDTVLIQGAGGGVATAAVAIARAGGLRVWVTSRDPARAGRAVELGAHRGFGAGERLPEKVDAVLDSVGAATWSHSINALRPGGRLVTVGTTSGAEPRSAELTKIFFKPLQVIGSTMGTRAELAAVLRLVGHAGLHPLVDRVLPLADAADGTAAARGRRGLRQDRPGALSGRSVLVVVQPGQPGGQLLDRALDVRMEVDERAELLGEPRQGDLVVTPACLELLDPSIGEVHPGVAQRKAESSSSRCCASCTLAEPTDGADEAGRVCGAMVHC